MILFYIVDVEFPLFGFFILDQLVEFIISYGKGNRQDGIPIGQGQKRLFDQLELYRDYRAIAAFLAQCKK